VQEGEPAFGSGTSATQTHQIAQGAAGPILRTCNGPLPAGACAPMTSAENSYSGLIASAP
jgi:hypothetical protein